MTLIWRWFFFFSSASPDDYKLIQVFCHKINTPLSSFTLLWFGLKHGKVINCALMKILMFSTHSMKYIWYSPQKGKISSMYCIMTCSWSIFNQFLTMKRYAFICNLLLSISTQWKMTCKILISNEWKDVLYLGAAVFSLRGGSRQK